MVSSKKAIGEIRSWPEIAADSITDLNKAITTGFVDYSLFTQTTSAKKPVGGIDLNSQFLNLQIKRDGQGIPLPMMQQPIQKMKIEGFFPIIINITPMPAVPLVGVDQKILSEKLSYNLN